VGVGGGWPGGARRRGHLGWGARLAGCLTAAKGKSSQEAAFSSDTSVGILEIPVDGQLGGKSVGVDGLEHVPLPGGVDLDPVVGAGPR